MCCAAWSAVMISFSKNCVSANVVAASVRITSMASCSLTTRKSIFSSAAIGTGADGATFKTENAPTVCAKATASATSATGISICSSSTSFLCSVKVLVPRVRLMFDRRFAETLRFAPLPTAIWFSPCASTTTDATAVGNDACVAKPVIPTPASAKVFFKISPNASAPTAPTNSVFIFAAFAAFAALVFAVFAFFRRLFRCIAILLLILILPSVSARHRTRARLVRALAPG
mmetsp:Transcript_4744/g.17518  ORF Transcript_4744/g.17518 Transcript_4744/m.17518 type:complete len:230 (+) Transcript_4744:555-1244(+)